MTNLRLSPTLSNRSSEESIDTSSTSATAATRPKQRRSTKEANPEAITPHDYKCPLCSEILPCQRDFTAHIRAHNEVKPQNDPNDPTGQAKVYYCCLCGKMLSSFSSLDRHMLVHSGERPFSCHLCGQTFTTNGNMHRHSRTHGNRDSHESDISSSGSVNGGIKRGGGRKRKASVDNPQPMINGIGSTPHVPCSNTAASSPSPMAMSELLKPDQHHYLNKLTGNVPPHVKCPMCSEMFYSEISMETHISIAHAGQCIDCDECKQKFPNYGYLRLHKNIYHHRSDASFPSLSSLQSLSKMNSLVSPIPHIPILPPSPVIPPIQKLPKVDSSIAASPKKEEKILDLSSPVKKFEPSLERSPAKSRSIAAPSEGDMESVYDEHEELLKDMKLKGEFPCRLCPAVYPNLRALKGHNKEHMHKPPYVCNVGECTYSSNDKSTLARHMRTHTGEKPFECTICNFGFTTKANCERHVKNKHGKNTREEVVESIIIHESDETGTERMLNSSMTESNASSYQDNNSEHLASPPKKRKEDSSDLSSDAKKANMFFAPYHNSLFRPAVEESKPSDVERTDDSPLDLSRPIGNLPLKIKEFSKEKLIDGQQLPIPMDLKAQEDFAKSFAAAAAAAASSNAYPGLTGQAPLPFLFSHLASTGQFDLTAYLLAQQEALRRQREVEAASAVSAAKDPASFLMHLSNLQSMASRAGSFPSSGSNASRGSIETSNSFYHSQQHHDIQNNGNIDKSDSDSDNYKMVIKNGVLMKKQKQRRYRTERPHECACCNARFTLRSNMERHIKQQHAGESSGSTNTSSISLQRHENDMKEDEDRDENEDSDVEIQQDTENEIHSNVIANRKIDMLSKSKYETNETEEEEEEGVDLSCLEKLVKGTKPFNTFFDNTEDEDEEVNNEDNSAGEKKMSAYSTAPNKIPCPYCGRTFPWLSSLKRHILTHTGDKPFKCHECPLWFTTKSNCDRHLVRKHGNNNNDQDIVSKRLDYSKTVNDKHDDVSSFDDDVIGETEIDVGKSDDNLLKSSRDGNCSAAQQEYPFKCHLCDDKGFSEREHAIHHLQSSHPDEYDNLLSKGAFDMATKQESSSSPNSIEPNGEDTFDQIRGRFPDYVNRKIVCLFCMRKFWSAEDLRRHVRTHTGERPYSCDICQRKFTLKHSMLRHRKKHDSGVSSGGNDSSDDTDSESGVASVSIGTGSFEDRSSPEDLGTLDSRVSSDAKDLKADNEVPTKHASELKKKRLMDKINKLSSAVTTTDGTITKIFETITNGNEIK